jgi:hypothetical protein
VDPQRWFFRGREWERPPTGSGIHPDTFLMKKKNANAHESGEP